MELNPNYRNINLLTDRPVPLEQMVEAYQDWPYYYEFSPDYMIE